MRTAARTYALCLAGALLAGCGGSAPPPHPQGWTAQGTGASTVWVDPASPEQRYRFSRTSAAGQLGDLASSVTTNTLLRYKGSKLLKGVPFPACPGEAGLQTFSLKTARGVGILEVAFATWNGNTTVASYERPAAAAQDPAAESALRAAVCNTPL